MITQKVHDLVAEVGENLKSTRLRKNLTQQELSVLAGISLGCLKAIEAGQGASFKSVAAMAMALGETRWILAMSPPGTVNPLTMTSTRKPRLRARKKSNE